MEMDQQFVEYIVKNLVNNPDAVKTERKVDDQGILITVSTAPEDTGYVIGKSGRTAVAIRTLLATMGAKNNQRISFRVDAPMQEGRAPRPAAGAAAPAEEDSGDSLMF